MDMLDTVFSQIERLAAKNEPLIVAIDGRCAAGKTTLAEELRKAIPCNVFHMDDFFLRAEQRTRERYLECGGNSDRERFLSEVLLPTVRGEDVLYAPFDCRTMLQKHAEKIKAAHINIVEGTYSAHPELWKYYDLHIFLTVSPEKQLERIARRGGDTEAFRTRWIPLEENYFSGFDIEKRCELRFET